MIIKLWCGYKRIRSKLKKFKFKIDEYDDINFSAEKDAMELEKEVSELDIEEKDLKKQQKIRESYWRIKQRI